MSKGPQEMSVESLMALDKVLSRTSDNAKGPRDRNSSEIEIRIKEELNESEDEAFEEDLIREEESCGSEIEYHDKLDDAREHVECEVDLDCDIPISEEDSVTSAGGSVEYNYRNADFLMSDELLRDLPVRLLNQHLKWFTQEDAALLRMKRRTLKNRDYARTSRSKKVTRIMELENANWKLQEELVRTRQELKRVAEERDYLKIKYEPGFASFTESKVRSEEHPDDQQKASCQTVNIPMGKHTFIRLTYSPLGDEESEKEILQEFPNGNSNSMSQKQSTNNRDTLLDKVRNSHAGVTPLLQKEVQASAEERINKQTQFKNTGKDRHKNIIPKLISISPKKQLQGTAKAEVSTVINPKKKLPPKIRNLDVEEEEDPDDQVARLERESYEALQKEERNQKWVVGIKQKMKELESEMKKFEGADRSELESLEGDDLELVCVDTEDELDGLTVEVEPPPRKRKREAMPKKAERPPRLSGNHQVNRKTNRKESRNGNFDFNSLLARKTKSVSPGTELESELSGKSRLKRSNGMKQLVKTPKQKQPP